MCSARRVLVVEDTPALRTLLAHVLTDEGYTVSCAIHGAHALTLLPAVSPCVILLDLHMPVMDGRAFAQAYHRREDADAHIIVMTAAAQVGEVDVIAPVHVAKKPFDLVTLLLVVERWVQAHEHGAV